MLKALLLLWLVALLWAALFLVFVLVGERFKRLLAPPAPQPVQLNITVTAPPVAPAQVEEDEPWRQPAPGTTSLPPAGEWSVDELDQLSRDRIAIDRLIEETGR